jgi:hypothetical protein
MVQGDHAHSSEMQALIDKTQALCVESLLVLRRHEIAEHQKKTATNS